jgi:hypothetical protein
VPKRLLHDQYRITHLWAMAFRGTWRIPAEYVRDTVWLDVVASIVAFLGAVWFTCCLAAVRQRFANAAASWAGPIAVRRQHRKRRA